MSTRNERDPRPPGGSWQGVARRDPSHEPVEEVALVAAAKRELLLHVHRFRLRREDLEDCYSQATLELMLRARQGGGFASRTHVANAIEQRFLSRVYDRRRALSGRSPIAAALEHASPIEPGDRLALVDARAELERLVLMRQELRRIEQLARRLTPDQRLVLACQIGAQMPPSAFCERYGWSTEKYRKVAQRARARLRWLMAWEGMG